MKRQIWKMGNIEKKRLIELIDKDGKSEDKDITNKSIEKGISGEENIRVWSKKKVEKGKW